MNPVRTTGESNRSRTSSSDSGRYTSASPRRSASDTATRTETSCVGFVDTPRSPDGSYQASTPASSHQAPTSSIDRAAASIVRRPPSPWRSSSRPASSYRPLTNPPLRPLGPPPQMSRSSSTTSRAGSRSLRNHAVHIPVYPPPRMTTSAAVSPSSGGVSGPANSGSASASSSHQLRRAGRGVSRYVNGARGCSRAAEGSERSPVSARRRGGRHPRGRPFGGSQRSRRTRRASGAARVGIAWACATRPRAA
jgi:hypothetical protein